MRQERGKSKGKENKNNKNLSVCYFTSFHKLHCEDAVGGEGPVDGRDSHSDRTRREKRSAFFCIFPLCEGEGGKGGKEGNCVKS